MDTLDNAPVKGPDSVEDMLNDCIERLLRGESVQSCVGRYPGHAAELLPLLKVAQAAIQASASVASRQEVRARGLAQLMRAASRPRPRQASPVVRYRRLLFSPLAIGFAAFMLVAVAAGGTTVAASSSVPGDPLYWVKTTRESITLRMPRSDAEKAQVLVHLANVRSYEARQLALQGRFEEAEHTAARAREHLREAAVSMGVVIPLNPVEMPVAPIPIEKHQGVAELRLKLQRDGQFLRGNLQYILIHAPPERKQRVRETLRQFELQYRTLMAAFDSDGPPMRRPFWTVEGQDSFQDR